MLGPVIYSVWNPATRSYDYWQATERTGTHAPNPAPMIGSSELGATPEEAAWRLPAHARRIGSGDLPRGRIASLGGDDAAAPASVPSYVWWGAGALLAWRFLR